MFGVISSRCRVKVAVWELGYISLILFEISRLGCEELMGFGEFFIGRFECEV